VSDGRWQEARAIFEWSIEAHPASPYAHALHAWALERMGQSAEAAEQWTRAAAVAEREDHPSLSHFQAMALSNAPGRR
jgi:Tfp pilus assembly protein PilF